VSSPIIGIVVALCSPPLGSTSGKSVKEWSFDNLLRQRSLHYCPGCLCCEDTCLSLYLVSINQQKLPARTITRARVPSSLAR
jgi:hypothetical protein